MEIAGRGDCPFVPANCPGRTENGLGYSCSTAANRAFEGEAQGRPTPCANSSTFLTGCGAECRGVACLHKEVRLCPAGAKEAGGVYRPSHPQQSPSYKLVDRFYPQFKAFQSRHLAGRKSVTVPPSLPVADTM